MKCRFCGKENEKGYAFCVYCGKKLEAEKAPVTLAKESKLSQIPEQEEVQVEAAKVAAAEMEAPSENKAELKAGVNDEPIMPVQGGVATEATSKGKVKKNGKLKIVAALLAIIVGGAGIGTGAFYLAKNMGGQVKTYEESYDPNTIFGIKLTSWESGSYGELYTHKIGEEKKKIDEGFDWDSFITSPQTGDMVYLNEEGDLRYVKVGGQPKTIGKATSYIDYYFDTTGRYLIFIEEKDSGDRDTYTYDIEKDSKELLVEGEAKNVYYHADSDEFYYIDNDNKFYRLVNRTEKHRIATDIGDFNVLDSGCYLLASDDKHNSTYYCYLETKDGVEKEEIDSPYVHMWNVVYIKDSQAIIYSVTNQETYSRQICIRLPGQKSLKLLDEVEDYSYSEDTKKIYYLDKTNTLYSMDLPEINKKALADQTYFEKVLADCNAVELLTDVTSYSVSPNGKVVIANDSNKDLFLLKEGTKKKIASDVIEQQAYNAHIYYLNLENEFYVQQGVDKEKLETLAAPVLIAESLGENCSVSEYGRYVTYLLEQVEGKETSKLMRYDAKKGIETVLEDATVYDGFVINELEYEQPMSYQEIVGSYACEELEVLIEILDDGEFVAYTDGEELGRVYPTYDSYARYRLSVDLADNDYLSDLFEDEILIRKQENSSLKITTTGYSYSLENISSEVFKEKLDEQARVAEERRAAEAERIRRENLEYTANYYYTNGAFVPVNTYIYTTYDYDTITTLYTNKDKTWSITNYHIDYDNEVIWVEISYTYQGNYDYGWLPIQQ